MDVVPPSVPPPEVINATMVTPAESTLLLLTSCSCNTGCCERAIPAPAVVLGGVLKMSFVGGHGFPVAVKVTVALGIALLVAVIVLLPAPVPSVLEPAAAMRLAAVVVVAPVTLPPPVATANVTGTPATTLPSGSLARTVGGVIVPPAVPVALLPVNATSSVAAAAVVVTLAETVVSPMDVKLSVLPPAAPAIARSVNVALPSAAVVAVTVPLSVPVELVASATVTTLSASATALPLTSCTCTTGCVAKTARFTAGELGAGVSASLAAAPGTPVAVKVIGEPVSPVLV